ncbi:hypothetical protein ACMTN4_01385 (plasmid) [Rhodococcus globerulus]
MTTPIPSSTTLIWGGIGRAGAAVVFALDDGRLVSAAEGGLELV